MIKNLLFLFLFIISFHSFSQGPLNPGFDNISEVPCSFDNSSTVTLPENWIIYQTIDGKWDGIIDSTRCISMIQDNFNEKIELSQIDPNLPLYIRNIINDSNKPQLKGD